METYMIIKNQHLKYKVTHNHRSGRFIFCNQNFSIVISIKRAKKILHWLSYYIASYQSIQFRQSDNHTTEIRTSDSRRLLAINVSLLDYAQTASEKMMEKLQCLYGWARR